MSQIMESYLEKLRAKIERTMIEYQTPTKNTRQDKVEVSGDNLQNEPYIPVGQSFFSPYSPHCGPIGISNLGQILNLDPMFGHVAYSIVGGAKTAVGFSMFNAAQFPSVMPAESMLWIGKSEEEIKKEVKGALENKNYDWRTIDGIVRETHLPKDEVCDMIKQLAKEGLVVRAPYLDKKGRQIYTTRKHYHETVGLLGRLISSLTNRIV